MNDRLEISKESVLKKMKEIDIANHNDVSAWYALIEMVAMPTLPPEEKVASMTSRQYLVSRNSFTYANRGEMKNAWWEICDFVEASNNDNLSFLELQMLCMMLRFWLYAAGEDV